MGTSPHNTKAISLEESDFIGSLFNLEYLASPAPRGVEPLSAFILSEEEERKEDSSQSPRPDDELASYFGEFAPIAIQFLQVVPREVSKSANSFSAISLAKLLPQLISLPPPRVGGRV